jgi:hypothetical protein
VDSDNRTEFSFSTSVVFVSINTTYISSLCRWPLLVLAINSFGNIIFHRYLVEILDRVLLWNAPTASLLPTFRDSELFPS